MKREIVAAACIASHTCINHRDTFIKLAGAASSLIIKEVKWMDMDRKFTVELNKNNRLLFPDVMVYGSSDVFITSIYHKPTNAGKCMNGEGKCTQDYKRRVIKAYMMRAIKVCCSWHLLHAELQHLVNNGYSNTGICQLGSGRRPTN
ncbi:uncharacterized protein LOC143034277 [Oratosquilla oratoria]|uniref:uncharacterized protein LOC143034277 n=1 Tax=Oratosquilla oratoria TaxID=337810 RepID=UPI003F76771B